LTLNSDLAIRRGRRRATYFLGWMERWWPRELGDPAASGARDRICYAFFPKPRRLLIETDGAVVIYDAADLQIWGMVRSGPAPVFNTRRGLVELRSLNRIGSVTKDTRDKALALEIYDRLAQNRQAERRAAQIGLRTASARHAEARRRPAA
jgi:hypothetical protein